ncbi:MAG: molybdopterin-dependent oxidoreductase [Coriobacteriales bacterium]|jgi:molybdopterin-containing oxidoreductase family molybdopterin binding subunit|nr:molybdopterin-dependent oxidoreductase [Coriobacteriales bacterium]
MSENAEKPSDWGYPHLTRRSFLKTTTAIAGTVALGGGMTSFAGCSNTASRTMNNVEEAVKTVSCCWTCQYCQYNAVVRDGRIVKLEPKKEGSLRGSRMCLRGRSRFRALNNPNRIKYPLKRIGERGEDKWEQITWDEAIETIAEKWKKFRDEYGNRSIAYYWGSGNASALASGNFGGLMGRFANVMECTWLDYCTDMALGYGTSRALGAAASQNEAYDIKNADKVFMWGISYTDSWWQLWWPLAEAMEHGTQLYVIDPSLSTTASKADVWVSNKAGTDPIIILSVMNYLVEHKLYNHDFLLKHTTACVLVRKDNNMLLRMSDLGVAPEEGPTDPLTGKATVIDPPVVWDTATNEAVAHDKSSEPALSGDFVVNGIKVDTSFDRLTAELSKYPPEQAAKIAGISVEEIETLAVAQSNGNVYNIPGYASQAYANGGEFGHALAMLALLTGSLGRPGASVGATWWSFPTNGAFLAPTGTGVNAVPVLGMSTIMETGKLKGKEYPIKSLLVAAGNPICSSASTNDMLKWWNKIEFIVVIDIQFSDTARFADILLPATHALENEDIMVSSYYPYVGVTEKASEPVYETKSDADIARLFAEAMGFGKYFEKSDDDYLREIIDESPTAKKLGITVERIRKEKEICFDEKGIRFEGCVFPTETGKANIYLETVAPRIDWGQELDPEIGHVPTWFPPHEAWADSESSQKYPLILNSQRLRTRWHTGEFENEWMLEVSPEPTVKINPVDAEKRGIKDGDYVEVFNDRGHAVARAEYANDRHPGVLIYPKGWQMSQFKVGSWSELTSPYADPFAVNTSFMDVAVDVRPWIEGR